MTLVGFPPVSDADLMKLGELNPGWHFERDDEGSIAVSPTSWKSGAASVEASFQLRRWAAAGAGGLVLDASTGFRLRTNAVRCPDAAWVSQERVDDAEISDPNGFFPGAPDVAIEIASPSDQWSLLIAKMKMFIRYGTSYAIAIDCRQNRIFELGSPPRGLCLDLDAIRRAGA